MNYAIIDLGSNTIRLAVYSYENNKMEKILNKKEIAGLAGYVTNGYLESAGIKKACDILNYFKLNALKFAEASDVYLFATASLRNIENREQAVKAIIEETALIPDVLDGEEEAALGFVGASQYLKCENGIMIDIGGASTELVLFTDYAPVKLISLPIGCLNLSAQYVSEVIPTKKERTDIKAAIKERLAQIDWEKDTPCPLMVGVGGTLRAAQKLSGVLFDLPAEQNNLKSDHVKELIKLLNDNEDDIYHTVYKTIPERLMTISTGLAILQQVVKKFGCESIAVSQYGIREGYLLDGVISASDKQGVDEGKN